MFVLFFWGVKMWSNERKRPSKFSRFSNDNRSMNVTWMIQSTYQVALVASVLCANKCVKSPAKKGVCFPSNGYLSMISISDSQQTLDRFKFLTSSHSLGEITQIPLNLQALPPKRILTPPKFNNSPLKAMMVGRGLPFLLGFGYSCEN